MVVSQHRENRPVTRDHLVHYLAIGGLGDSGCALWLAKKGSAQRDGANT